MIDEEHENTYKSEQTPRYHARETAEARAKMEGASVVLGSATPSMESMYRARLGEYRLLELKKRSREQEMADVYVTDLREELKNGNRSILSEKLQEIDGRPIKQTRTDHVFLNRRGYAGFISCRELRLCCENALTATCRFRFNRGGKNGMSLLGHEEAKAECLSGMRLQTYRRI